mgnify:CR=1 FL=1
MEIICGRAILRVLAQRMIAKYEGCHCLDHRNGTRKHTGIMPAACGKLGVLPGHGHGLLWLRDSSGGLESDAK